MRVFCLFFSTVIAAGLSHAADGVPLPLETAAPGTSPPIRVNRTERPNAPQ
jgi:hypothetical protein